MSRKDVVKGVVDYFNGEQWNTFITGHLMEPKEEIYHAHVYVDTSIHPDSLMKVMEGYFKAKGWDLDRKIDLTSPKPNVAGLHGIHPFGMPHFDFFFRFNPNAVLEPMPPTAKEAEHGSNLLSWGKSYQDNFLSKFNFKCVGPREEKEIRNYFLSRHWKKTLEYTVDDNVTHCHGYVEINFDPKILELLANEALAKIGWTVEKVVPCVFDVHGEYRGKIVYLIGNPEKMFDIGWVYNPNVTIKPSEDVWVLGTPGFDLWTWPMYDKVLADGNFQPLTDDEVKEVVAAFK
ncbi:MAG: hypothetical protein HPY71_15765 [Firmicutes bacterium]|nr:hypothetical protein [Bacillota bacterium]